MRSCGGLHFGQTPAQGWGRAPLIQDASCYNLIIQDWATHDHPSKHISSRHTPVLSSSSSPSPLVTAITAVTVVTMVKKALFKGTDDHPCLLGAGPPPGPPRFPVFVFPRSLAALRRPGRPHSERSKSIGPSGTGALQCTPKACTGMHCEFPEWHYTV